MVPHATLPPWIQQQEWTISRHDPHRKDPTDDDRAAARVADRMPMKDVLALLGGADVDEAIARFGFPQSIGRTVAALGGLNRPHWSRRAVLAWRVELESFVKNLRG